MTDPVRTIARTDNPEDCALTGQPLWYWALSREGKEEVLRRRAKAAGAEYGEDLSSVGVLPDGSPPPKAKRTIDAPGLKMSARRRAEIEARAKELLTGKGD